MPETAALTHTCGRCEVTASWAPGTDRPALPIGWILEDGDRFCLSCRRERAAEAVVIGDDVPAAEIPKLRSAARIEFEIKREPDLPDSRIAKACRTSTMTVRKARARIGLPPPPRA